MQRNAEVGLFAKPSKIAGGVAEMSIRKTLLSTLFVLLALADSWALNMQEAIVGKWQKTDGTAVLTVAEDGKVFVTRKRIVLKGNYDFIDEKRVSCDFKFRRVVYTVTISGDVLTLMDAKGKVSTYRRKITQIGAGQFSASQATAFTAYEEK